MKLEKLLCCIGRYVICRLSFLKSKERKWWWKLSLGALSRERKPTYHKQTVYKRATILLTTFKDRNTQFPSVISVFQRTVLFYSEMPWWLFFVVLFCFEGLLFTFLVNMKKKKRTSNWVILWWSPGSGFRMSLMCEWVLWVILVKTSKTRSIILQTLTLSDGFRLFPPCS